MRSCFVQWEGLCDATPSHNPSHCENQEEIDYYWEKLSAAPGAEQCGWLKDRYGLSWQMVPTVMGKMMQDQDPERLVRVTQAFLKMKKLDLAALQRAYDGK
jgi:predicted 3-demethylubiquinone-9 3-methyltransferase (glyoxalase superfamily)